MFIWKISVTSEVILFSPFKSMLKRHFHTFLEQQKSGLKGKNIIVKFPLKLSEQD